MRRLKQKKWDNLPRVVQTISGKAGFEPGWCGFNVYALSSNNNNISFFSLSLWRVYRSSANTIYLQVSEASITNFIWTKVTWRRKSRTVLSLGINHYLDYGKFHWANRISSNHSTEKIHQKLDRSILFWRFSKVQDGLA